MITNRKLDATKKENPFGQNDISYEPEPQTSYAPETDEEKSAGWLKLGVFILVVMLISTFVGNMIVYDSYRKSAVQSIMEFNSSVNTIHETLTSPQTINDLRQVQSLQPRDDDEAKSIEAAASVEEMITTMRGSVYEPLTEDMPRDQAIAEVAPYYALCDAVSLLSTDYPSLRDEQEKCSSFSSTVFDMMDKVKRFNDLNNSASGKINPMSKNDLPSVLKDGYTVPDETE